MCMDLELEILPRNHWDRVKKAGINEYRHPIYVNEHSKIRNELLESLHELVILKRWMMRNLVFRNTDKVKKVVLSETDFADNI